MWKGIRWLMVLLAVGALSADAAQAQVFSPRGQAGNDRLTFTVYGGGFSPTASFGPANTFRDSGTVGGNVTLWLHRNIGVRGSLLFAQTDAGPAVPETLAGEAPNVWAYSGDLVLRLPIQLAGGRDALVPYVVGGLGGKTYDFDRLSSSTDFAGNFGGGIEYRFARWGIQLEVRDIVSNFDRFGVDKTQHDVVWTGGITFSL